MYQRILVPIDGSPTAVAGLKEAMMLAKPSGARLCLMHVVDEVPFALSAEGYAAMSSDVLGLLKESGEALLAESKRRVEAEGIPVDTVLFDSLDGRLSERVADQTGEWGADLIVLGTHGRRGVKRLLLGSDAEQIVRTATVPVLLVRAAEAKR